MSDLGDERPAAAGWYDDSQANVRRYWDGSQWTDYTQPMQIGAERTAAGSRRARKWVIGALVGAVLLAAAAAATASFVKRSDDERRWSAFPRTASCSEDQEPFPEEVPNSALTTVEKATLTHLGDQKLALTLDFAVALPSARVVTSPYTDEPIIAPGSNTYNVLVSSEIGTVYTTLTPNGWGATRLDLGLAEILDEPIMDFPSDILTSVDTSAKSIRFEYNLDGQPKLFGDGPFTPDVRVNTQRTGPSTPSEPTGGISADYTSQLCSWNAAVWSDYPTGPATRSPSSTTGQSLPPTAQDDQGSCGLDESDALTEALSQLPPEPNTGQAWAAEPIASNFDACADLSTILVTVEGATGSSPVQALMFHRGEYLGTGTSQAYGFTDLDNGSSTSDTVVLTYETGQTCNACDDGVTTSVRYQWDGEAVQMLDPPPS